MSLTHPASLLVGYFWLGKHSVKRETHFISYFHKHDFEHRNNKPELRFLLSVISEWKEFDNSGDDDVVIHPYYGYKTIFENDFTIIKDFFYKSSYTDEKGCKFSAFGITFKTFKEKLKNPETVRFLTAHFYDSIMNLNDMGSSVSKIIDGYLNKC